MNKPRFHLAALPIKGAVSGSSPIDFCPVWSSVKTKHCLLGHCSFIFISTLLSLPLETFSLRLDRISPTPSGLQTPDFPFTGHVGQTFPFPFTAAFNMLQGFSQDRTPGESVTSALQLNFVLILNSLQFALIFHKVPTTRHIILKIFPLSPLLLPFMFILPEYVPPNKQF